MGGFYDFFRLETVVFRFRFNSFDGAGLGRLCRLGRRYSCKMSPDSQEEETLEIISKSRGKSTAEILDILLPGTGSDEFMRVIVDGKTHDMDSNNAMGEGTYHAICKDDELVVKLFNSKSYGYVQYTLKHWLKKKFAGRYIRLSGSMVIPSIKESSLIFSLLCEK